MTPPLIPMPLFFFTPSLYNSSRAFTMASLMVSPRDPAVVVKPLQNARLFDKYFMLKFINTAHSSLLRTSPYSLARASALPRALFAKSCLSALYAASQQPVQLSTRFRAASRPIRKVVPFGTLRCFAASFAHKWALSS